MAGLLGERGFKACLAELLILRWTPYAMSEPLSEAPHLRHRPHIHEVGVAVCPHHLG